MTHNQERELPVEGRPERRTDDGVVPVQEQAVGSGNVVVRGEVTDRVLRTDEAVMNYGPPLALIDRAVAFTEVSKKPRGRATVLRRAQGLMRFAETSAVAIFAEELIVGRPHSGWGVAGSSIRRSTVPRCPMLSMMPSSRRAIDDTLGKALCRPRSGARCRRGQRTAQTRTPIHPNVHEATLAASG